EYDVYIQQCTERELKYKRELCEYEKKKKAWDKLSKRAQSELTNKGLRPIQPSSWYHFDDHDRYIKLTPETVFYDDAMNKIRDEVKKHNQIATVLQGLLDRSLAFQPHPPWQIWTPEGSLLESSSSTMQIE